MGSATLRLNIPQAAVWRATETYVDYEGAVRSGKSTVPTWKFLLRARNEPGIHLMFSRWTDDSLDAQLRPLFRDIATEAGLYQPLIWVPKEGVYEWPNGSRIWFRALKSAEESMRYGKFAGLTLSGIYVDQPEEAPHDVIVALKARLSQPGYAHQMILTPNPMDEGHWLSTEFPEDNHIPDHLYLSTSVFDNAENLPPGYIDGLLREYPEGHALYRRFVQGKRGLSVIGVPVYGGKVFNRDLHVRPCAMDPTVPLIESWDFGFTRPAVLWSQFMPWGEWRVLGELMGDGQFLEDFAPIAVQRAAMLGKPILLHCCCDPAGDTASNQGMRGRAVEILQQFGRQPISQPNSNNIETRWNVIQHVASWLLRRNRRGGACVTLDSGCKILIDSFEAGYVWDNRTQLLARGPHRNIQVPRKDGYYDHLQNCVEYTWINFGPALTTSEQDVRIAERQQRRMEALAQKDADPYDYLHQRTREGHRKRGGY